MNGINVMSNDSRMAMNGEKTMSSREIAELTGKRHDNVMDAIKVVLEQAEIVALEYKGSYLSKQNKEMPCYNLPRRECDLVMSGYSVKYRLAIIDRWQELEAQQQHAIPTNFTEALACALELSKENDALVLTVQALKPQVAAYDALTKISGVISVSDYHKLLQSEHGITAIQKDVREWLNDEGYIFKRNGEWHRYASHADKFEEKIVPWSNCRGSSWVIYITEKGIRLVTPRIVEYFKDI